MARWINRHFKLWIWIEVFLVAAAGIAGMWLHFRGMWGSVSPLPLQLYMNCTKLRNRKAGLLPGRWTSTVTQTPCL